ncbi:hypothetical protein OE88DRAFT_205111 [Heliocybe sulcata]|uniref:Uncharacterized protein n=1 Tax=Heliocybe sulcata TaxID=5364 RepID=A0A5C3N1U9_9AGAM|nr:hypothetical protein OE88DRAFT_205111 [Heliocybe sulcata]
MHSTLVSLCATDALDGADISNVHCGSRCQYSEFLFPWHQQNSRGMDSLCLWTVWRTPHRHLAIRRQMLKVYIVAWRGPHIRLPNQAYGRVAGGLHGSSRRLHRSSSDDLRHWKTLFVHRSHETRCRSSVTRLGRRWSSLRGSSRTFRRVSLHKTVWCQSPGRTASGADGVALS